MDLSLERALKILETPTVGATPETVEFREGRIKSCRLIAAHLCNPALRYQFILLVLFYYSLFFIITIIIFILILVLLFAPLLFLLIFVVALCRANTDFAAQVSRGIAALLHTCGDKDMSVWTVADETLNKVIKVRK